MRLKEINSEIEREEKILGLLKEMKENKLKIAMNKTRIKFGGKNYPDPTPIVLLGILLINFSFFPVAFIPLREYLNIGNFIWLIPVITVILVAYWFYYSSKIQNKFEKEYKHQINLQ